jgi:hypothetical protein
MVEGIGNTPTGGSTQQIYSEYEEVQQALQKAFPGKTELEIQQAVVSYLGTVQGQNAGGIDSQAMLAHITKAFNVEISAQAASDIKTEWEDLTQSLDIDVADLAAILTDYAPDGIDKTDRAYIMLLWEQLQGELEGAVVEESTVVATANKQLQESEFKVYLDKKAEEMEKAGKGGLWAKIKRWACVVASVLAAVTACVLIATGVGAPAGAALMVGAACLVTLAVASTVSAILDECGVEWTLGQGVGKLLAKLINACGGDVDEDKFATWTAFAVQMTLTVVAVVCTLGVGSAAAPAANASNMAKLANMLPLVTGAMGIATGLIQVDSAVGNYLFANMQAALLELKALLEQLGETRAMDQELTAAILNKIFEAMRGNVADAMDTALQDLELVTSMHLNKA